MNSSKHASSKQSKFQFRFDRFIIINREYKERMANRTDGQQTAVDKDYCESGYCKVDINKL